jgi:hypothetical protein
MAAPETARTRDVLSKRIKRLLRLDQPESDQSELRSKVLPFLGSLGSVALIGGAIRDVARAGRQGFSSDLDFVIYGGCRDDFVHAMEIGSGTRNKFGGYRLNCFRWQVDVWHIEDTWAKTAGHVDVTNPRDLLKCTFFDWDSAIYEVKTGRLTIPEDYLERLHLNVMDIRLEHNPNPAGSVIRALRRAALWRVQFGPRLTTFTKDFLKQADWQSLAEIDSRAFSRSVIRHLDRDRILSELDNHNGKGVTTPVPEWHSQLSFRL